MSEPKTHAEGIETVRADLLHWWVDDDRIGTRSDAWAVLHDGRIVLIDPLPLAEGAIEALEAQGQPVAVLLTSSSHQRSAWRLRKRFGIKVYAPQGAEGLDEVPDVDYAEGVALPGGLTPVHAPGPSEAHYVLHLDRDEGMLFCADVLLHEEDRLRFLTSDCLGDPERTRESARRLLDLRFGVLCPAHGAAITQRPKDAIRKALDADAASRA
jgi:glyoxylase-like metal-dependent hydrolase (beta-lactamase superfamily II)